MTWGSSKSVSTGWGQNAQPPAQDVSILEEEFPALGLGGQHVSKKSQLPPQRRKTALDNGTLLGGAQSLLPPPSNSAWAPKPPMHRPAHDSYVNTRDKDTHEVYKRQWEGHRDNQGSSSARHDLEAYKRTVFAAQRDEMSEERRRPQDNDLKERFAIHNREPITLRDQVRAEDVGMQRARLVADKSLLEKPKPVPTPEFHKLKARDGLLDKTLDRRRQKRRIFPPALKPDQEAKVQEILRTPYNDIVATIPAAEVCGKDIQKLRPREWLNDEVINFYTVMLNLRSKAYQADLEKLPEGERPPIAKRKYLKIHAFNSFFVAKLRSSGATGGYAGVRRWTKKVDIFACDAVLMPVNQGNTHWTAACINLRHKRFEYYDSIGSTNANLLKLLRQYLREEHKDKKGSDIDLSEWTDYQLGEEAPQQENAFDCGVFTSQVLECLSRPDAALDYAQENMTYLRKKMVWEIWSKSFLEDEQWE